MKVGHTYGKKMVRKVHTKVIYKGTFVSKQSLQIQNRIVVGEIWNVYTWKLLGGSKNFTLPVSDSAGNFELPEVNFLVYT